MRPRNLENCVIKIGSHQKQSDPSSKGRRNRVTAKDVTPKLPIYRHRSPIRKSPYSSVCVYETRLIAELTVF